MAETEEAIPAATVIVMREVAEGPPELLMVERAAAMRFAGGALVFPGGRIDPGDYVLAGRAAPELEDGAAASGGRRGAGGCTGGALSSRGFLPRRSCRARPSGRPPAYRCNPRDAGGSGGPGG